MTTKKKTAKKNEYAVADFLKIASLSGSSLKTSTATNSGTYPVTFSEKNGTPLLVSFAYAASAKKYGEKVNADTVLSSLSDIVSDNYGKYPEVKKMISKVTGKNGKPYTNEKRLLSDLRNKTKIGGILYFAPSGEKARGELLSEETYNRIKKIV